MNYTSPIPGNHNHTGKYDAYIVPDSETNDASFELTVLDKEIPSFEINPNKPGKQPSSTAPLPGLSDPNRPNLPSYSTGGASGFIVPKPSKSSPPAPVSSASNDAPVPFEVLPDFTRDRSFRHYDVAPPPLPHAPADAEAHIPVADTPSPMPAIILKNDLSSYWKQPSAALHTITPDAAHTLPPVSESPEPGAATSLSHPATQEHSADNTLPTHPGSGSELASLESAVQAVVAPPPAAENRPVDPPIEHAAFVVPELASPEVLDNALRKLIRAIPLLSEDDLLASLAEPEYGGFMLSHKTLKQALIRTGLETDYKRYRAYITG